MARKHHKPEEIVAKLRQVGVTPWNGQDSTVGGINREYWSGVACPS